MTKNKRKYIIYLVLIIVATALLMGCAAVRPKEADLNESLRNKAKAYWDMRMNDKYDETYKMEDRESLPPYPEYINKAMLIKKWNLKSYSIRDLHMEGDKGSIDLEFSFIMPPVTKPFKQTIKDEWVYKDGRWRHKFK